MYQKAKYLTTISCDNLSTSYLFCKEGKILIPVETENYNPSSSIIALSSIAFAFDIKFINSKLNRMYNGSCGAQISLKRNNRVVNINTSPFVAVKAAALFNKPLLIEDRLVKTLGLKVTKEMIQEAIEYAPVND